MAATASALAQQLAQHDDDAVQQAILLLISQRPQLQASLLSVLQEPAGQRYEGTIKSFWPDKHYGFIECHELKSHYGGDVFLSDMEIGSFGIGSAVSFSIMLNKDGRPQAKLLQAGSSNLPPPAILGPLKRSFIEMQAATPPSPLPPVRKVPPPPVLVPALPMWTGKGPELCPPPTENVVDERHTGVIKSFWPDKCYGFIACEELAAAFGGDVFLSDQEVGEFREGDAVTFSVAMNKNGRPQARGLQAAGAY